MHTVTTLILMAQAIFAVGGVAGHQLVAHTFRRAGQEFLFGEDSRARQLHRSLLNDGGWEELASLPEIKTMGEVSAGVLTASSGKPYMLVIGQSPGKFKSTSTMIYDFSTDTWSLGAPREHVGNHHAADVANNAMYVLGGLDEGLHSVQIAKLKETDAGVDVEWSYGADVPVPSGSSNTALMGGKILYCGGIEETKTNTIPDCMTYDIASDSWTGPGDVPPMPQGRNHAAACTDGKSMFIFGGRTGGNVVGPGFNDTQIYTPGSGWKTGTPLPVARGGMGKAVYLNGECWVFGGEVDTKTAPLASEKINPTRTVYRVDIYNIAQDSWRLGPDMPTGMHGIFPVYHAGKVHIAGGGTEAGYSQSTLHYALTVGSASKPLPVSTVQPPAQPPMLGPSPVADEPVIPAPGAPAPATNTTADTPTAALQPRPSDPPISPTTPELAPRSAPASPSEVPGLSTGASPRSSTDAEVTSSSVSLGRGVVVAGVLVALLASAV